MTTFGNEKGYYKIYSRNTSANSFLVTPHEPNKKMNLAV
jgi:hypothetical protein